MLQSSFSKFTSRFYIKIFRIFVIGLYIYMYIKCQVPVLDSNWKSEYMDHYERMVWYAAGSGLATILKFIDILHLQDAEYESLQYWMQQKLCDIS